MEPDDPELEVHVAATHILAMLSDVQERLGVIRVTAERLAKQQEGGVDAAHP